MKTIMYMLMMTIGLTKMTTMVMMLMIRIRVSWDLPETTQALPLLAGNSSLQEIVIVCIEINYRNFTY